MTKTAHLLLTLNFSLTREVATATRHYGTFCGFEPAAAVDTNGVIGRIYNATASGARQLHDYTPNTLGHGGAAELPDVRTVAGAAPAANRRGILSVA